MVSPNYIFQEQYSTPLKDESVKENQSAVMRNPNFVDKLVGGFSDREASSCWDLFQMGVKASPNSPCVGERHSLPQGGFSSKYEWVTYKQFELDVLTVGSAFVRLGLVSQTEYLDEAYPPARCMKVVGVFSRNRKEWLELEQMVNAYGLVLVPLYDTLGDEALKFVVEQTNLGTVFVSQESVKSMVTLVQNVNTIKHLISFDKDLDSSVLDQLTKSGVSVHYWDDLKSEGVKNISPPTPSKFDDVMSICYTSGTTGPPKGVVYTHGSMISSIAGFLYGQSRELMKYGMNSNGVHLAYLPLAHIYERCVCNLVLVSGGRIGFSTGVSEIFSDAQILKPTMFASVPRVFVRMVEKVKEDLSKRSAATQYAFNWAVQAKLAKYRSSGSTSSWLWDRTILSEARNILGGRVEVMFTGSAPLDPHVQETISVLFSAPLLQAYGLTETTGATHSSSPRDPSVGHIGGPNPSVEFKLEAIEAMKFDPHSNPPRGEILVRGPLLSKGYFRNKEETSAVFDSDGWFHTGDVGELLPNGAVKVIDRLKNIFKLSQGEYVAPEKLEAIYAQSKYVSQIFVFGYSLENCLVGVVHLQEKAVVEWGTEHGMTEQKDIIASKKFKEDVMKEMNAVATRANLKGFEKVKNISFSTKSFQDLELVTPTLKLKRFDSREAFKKDIDRMYNEIKERA